MVWCGYSPGEGHGLELPASARAAGSLAGRWLRLRRRRRGSDTWDGVVTVRCGSTPRS